MTTTTLPAHVQAVLVTRDADGAVASVPTKIATPVAASRELLVRPAFVGICGTDISILHGRMPDTFNINYPHILGHEWSGVVEAVGDEVLDFSPGDRVLGHGHIGDNDWFGVTHDGAAAELFTVPARMCFPVPGNVDLLTAAVIEPFACVLNGMNKIGGTDASHTVHVHGLGGIGLSAMLQCIHSGARVIVFDPSEKRRALALSLGALGAIDPVGLDDICAAAVEAGGRPYADLVIEASGNPAAQALALEGADRNGRVLLLGLSRPQSATFKLALIIERNLTVTTSQGAPVEIWPAAIRYVAQSQIALSAIVSSIVPFSRGDEAMARAQNSATDIKVMLAPDGSEYLR